MIISTVVSLWAIVSLPNPTTSSNWIASVRVHQDYDFQSAANLFRRTAAFYQRNPYDMVGVMHNVLCDYADSSFAEGRSEKDVPNLEAIRSVLKPALTKAIDVYPGRGKVSKELLQNILEAPVPKDRDFNTLCNKAFSSQEDVIVFTKYMKEIQRLAKETPTYSRAPTESPRDPYWRYLDRYRRLEDEIMRTRMNESGKVILLSTASVARHSTYYWSTGEPREKSVLSDAVVETPELQQLSLNLDHGPALRSGRGWLRRTLQAIGNAIVGGPQTSGGNSSVIVGNDIAGALGFGLIGLIGGAAAGGVGAVPGLLSGLFFGAATYSLDSNGWR